MKYLENIPYLEYSDFNSNGSLKSHITRGKPVIVMCQGINCGYCNLVKPDFQKFSNTSLISTATIQMDSKETIDKGAIQMAVKLCPKLNKIPTYLLFNKDGSYQGYKEGGGKYNDLVMISKTL